MKKIVVIGLLLIPALLIAEPTEPWFVGAEKGYGLAVEDAVTTTGGYVCAVWGEKSERCKGAEEVVRSLIQTQQDIRDELKAHNFLRSKGLR